MRSSSWRGVDGALSGVAPELRAVLRCPVTGEELVDVLGPSGQVGLAAPEADLVYPVRDGVPVLLAHEASPLEG